MNERKNKSTNQQRTKKEQSDKNPNTQPQINHKKPETLATQKEYPYFYYLKPNQPKKCDF